MAKREYDHLEEAALAAHWQAAYEEELNSGAGNPIVEFFTYICFVSFSRGKGKKKRREPKHVELVGKRGGHKKYQMKNGEPQTNCKKQWNFN